MPSLVFTTLPEFSSPSSPSEAAMAQKGSALHAISLPVVLAIAGALVALVLISYGAYRFVKYRQREKGSLRPSLRPFFLRDDSVHSQPHDTEKAVKVIGKISGPALLFGTCNFVLNGPVIGDASDIRVKDVVKPGLEHDSTALPTNEEVYDAIHDATEIQGSAADDTVSRDLVEDTRIDDVQSTDTQSSTESEDTLIDEPCAVSKREALVLSDAIGLEGVGITKVDVDALKDIEEQCRDEVSVRAKAIATLTIKFEAFESLDEEAYLSKVKLTPFEEPRSFGSLSSSSSVFDIQTLDSADTSSSSPSLFDSSNPTIPKSGQLVPCWRSLKSKVDAEATLQARRVDMQRSPELCFVILNPSARVLEQFRPATAPFNYEYAPMRQESVQKLERCTASQGESMKYNLKSSSPLASGFVICGPCCMPRKDLKLKKALRRLVSSGIKTKDVPTSRTTIRSPYVPEPAIVVVDKGSSSDLLVEVLRRIYRRKVDRETLLALVFSFVEEKPNSPPLTPTPSHAAQHSPSHAANVSRPAPTMSAVSSRSPAVSASRARLIANKARPPSPPRTLAVRSCPEKRSTTSTCARMSTVIEEQEDIHIPPRPRSPIPMIDLPCTRNLGRATSPATNSKLLNVDLVTSPGRISRMPATPRPSPIPATSARIRPTLDRSSDSTRTSTPPSGPMRNASSCSSTSKSAKIQQVRSAPVPKPSRVNRVSLSDVTNSKSAPTSTSKPERRHGSSQSPSKPPQSAPTSTSRTSSVNHSRKSSKSNSENLLPPSRSPARTLISGSLSATLSSSRRASAMMKPAFRV